MKRLSLALFAALLVIATPAFADDDASRVLAGKLIDLTNGKDTMRAGFESVMNGVIDNMQRSGLPQQGVDEVHAAVSKWYDDQIKFEDIKPKMVDVYVKQFTKADLQQILAFYESPIGQKTIKNMPTVMRDGAMAAQDYTKAKIPSLNAILTPILTKYQAATPTSPGAPSGPGAGAPPMAPAPGN